MAGGARDPLSGVTVRVVESAAGIHAVGRAVIADSVDLRHIEWGGTHGVISVSDSQDVAIHIQHRRSEYVGRRGFMLAPRFLGLSSNSRRSKKLDHKNRSYCDTGVRRTPQSRQHPSMRLVFVKSLLDAVYC